MNGGAYQTIGTLYTLRAVHRIESVYIFRNLILVGGEQTFSPRGVKLLNVPLYWAYIRY